MKPSNILWLIVILWTRLYAVTFATIAVMIYLKRQIFLLVMDEEWINITISVTGIYAGWLFINIGTALRTCRSCKSGTAAIFLVQSFISLALELYFLVYVFTIWEELFKNILTKFVGGLVDDYTKSNLSRSYTDWINQKFQCCGLTQWHYEWWMNSKGSLKKGFNFAWVPDSCCVENSQYEKCGIALPLPKPGVTEEDKSASEMAQFYYESGPMAATYWYMRLNNEPCPEMIIEHFGEMPTYILLVLITLSFARFTISLAAAVVLMGRRKD